MTTFIGIDPGMSGGLALITTKTITSSTNPKGYTTGSVSNIHVIPMPLAGNELDVKTIMYFLIEEEFPVVCIEAVHSMPGNSARSMFQFGFGVGMLHGIIQALGLQLVTVTPQAWKKLILAGTDKSKEAAIDYCVRKYPEVNLFPTERSKKMSDGMAEALCIAEYAMRTSSQA